MKTIALILALASTTGCITVNPQRERLYEEKFVNCTIYSYYLDAYWDARCVVELPVKSSEELAELERRKKKYGVE